ncbi:ketimine reductase mu-crystallin isoform X2 [Drosophila busckii]|uniref:ketimine reductase mu-crystallin isoform X2 n=1 Tax=Drosophila busckii TaxID=30019 RepID=UPI00083EEFD6|nr:ketimine reductase mu-crystallin isoform X2 [Drosophila busckii]
MEPVYYNADAVRRVLSWPLVNDAVEQALKAVINVKQPNEAGAYVDQPARIVTKADPSKLLLAMPAFVGNYKLSGEASSTNSLACKLVTSFSSNQQRKPPLPSVAAHIMLFDVDTGELSAIMAGTDITTWRTVAASIVATKYLYLRRFAEERALHVAIVGCGVQGQLHARAMCANFKVQQLSLYNRTTAKATQLAKQLAAEFAQTQIEVCATAAEAVQQADVICVATYADVALFAAKDLRASRAVHINAVGAGEVAFGEIAADIYAESLVYVDSMENAAKELQDLPAPIVAAVGSVILQQNYPAANALTIFQSMGMASEDACVAEAVRRALQKKNTL